MWRSDHAGRQALTAVVLGHLAVTLAHGVSHGLQQVAPSAPAAAYIVIVIYAAPLVGLRLLRGPRGWEGAMTITAAMAGSLLFGLWNHFVVPGADHVAHQGIGAWASAFQATAVLLVVSEALGTWVGIEVLRESRGRGMAREEGR